MRASARVVSQIERRDSSYSSRAADTTTVDYLLVLWYHLLPSRKNSHTVIASNKNGCIITRPCMLCWLLCQCSLKCAWNQTNHNHLCQIPVSQNYGCINKRGMWNTQYRFKECGHILWNQDRTLNALHGSALCNTILCRLDFFLTWA